MFFVGFFKWTKSFIMRKTTKQNCLTKKSINMLFVLGFQDLDLVINGTSRLKMNSDELLYKRNHPMS